MDRKIKAKEAAQRLSCSLRSIKRYKKRFLEIGPEGLRDRRGGTHRRLTEKEELRIVQCKLEGNHRSARSIRDKLMLSFHQTQPEVSVPGGGRF